MQKNVNFLLVSKCLISIGFIFILVSILLMNLSAITVVSSSVSKTYGPVYSFILNKPIITENISYKPLGISYITLMAFIFLIISSICIILSFAFYKIKRYIPQLFILCSSLLVLVASILFLSSHKSLSIILATTLIGENNEAITTTIYNNSHIEFGIFGPSIFGFLSSFLLMASLIFDGTFDKIINKISPLYIVIDNKQSNSKKKIMLISFIYLFVLITFLSPFITIEGSNKMLGYIIASILTLFYLLIMLIFLWNWIKIKVKK